MDAYEFWLEFADILVWPVILIIVLLLYKQHIGQIILRIGKLKVGELIEIEIAKAADAALKKSRPSLKKGVIKPEELAFPVNTQTLDMSLQQGNYDRPKKVKEAQKNLESLVRSLAVFYGLESKESARSKNVTWLLGHLRESVSEYDEYFDLIFQLLNFLDQIAKIKAKGIAPLTVDQLIMASVETMKSWFLPSEEAAKSA